MPYLNPFDGSIIVCSEVFLRFSCLFLWTMWIWQLLKPGLVMDNSLYPMWQFIFPEGTMLTPRLLKVAAAVVSGVKTRVNCHSFLRGGSLQHKEVGKWWQAPCTPGWELLGCLVPLQLSQAKHLENQFFRLRFFNSWVDFYWCISCIWAAGGFCVRTWFEVSGQVSIVSK